MHPHRIIKSVVLAAIAGCAPLASAQTADGDSLFFTVGSVAERVAAATDSSNHYALFIPSIYESDRALPVVFIMDPRGRALVALELFRPAAEQLGYLLLSSYETLSDADSAYAVNDRALSAMLVDAQVRFGADASRLYLAGFSGTAHYAWDVAASLDGHLAGIIGAGDGLTMNSIEAAGVPKMTRPPVYYGTAGTDDFNYEGARNRDLALDDTSIPHRFVMFDGGHSWPPEEVAGDAMMWIHLRAMQSGIARLDTAFVDSLFDGSLRQARNLERDGRLADAYRRYREIANDFDGLHDVAVVRRQLGLLGLNARTKRQMARRADLSRRFTLYTLRMHEVADSFRDSSTIPSESYVAQALQFDELSAQASGSADPDSAAAARRMLAAAFVRFSFYEARNYFEERDFEKAAGVLRVARTIRPEMPVNCLRLARAEAQLGRHDAAIDAVQCAVRGGVEAESLKYDPLLEPIASDPRFRRAIAE